MREKETNAINLPYYQRVHLIEWFPLIHFPLHMDNLLNPMNGLPLVVICLSKWLTKRNGGFPSGEGYYSLSICRERAYVNKDCREYCC